MARRLLIVLVCALGSAGCSVQVTGAACLSDENCPTGQVCEAGLCVEGKRCDCIAGNTRCAADGTIVQCVDDGAGCFSFPLGGGQACSAPEVCVQAKNAAACACPPAGELAGSGCSSAGEVTCGGQAVLRCERRDSCLVWELVEDCGAAGAACVEENNSATCSCPANDGSELYVDPIRGREASSPLPPTGAANPPSCRYRRVSDALPAATTGSTILLTGFDRAGWTKLTRYEVGEQVIPSVRNGFLYQVVQAGLSGSEEPKWPLAMDATVGDNEVVWKRLSLDAVTFELEKFPLDVPAGVTLRAVGCAVEDADCDPTRYALLFSGANGGQTALRTLSLGEGATLAGFTVMNVGGTPLSSAIECTTGAVTVRRMILLGARDQTTPQVNGIRSTGNCSLTVEDSAIGRYGRGLSIESTASTRLSRVTVGRIGAQEVPVDVGLELLGGQVTAEEVRVANARLQGIVVEGSGTQATLRASEVSGSGGGAATPDEVAPGVMVRNGALRLEGSSLSGNLGPGLHVENGSVTVERHATQPTRIDGNGSTAQTTPEVGSGIRLAGGTLSGTGLEVKGNLRDGILIHAGKVTLDEAIISENGRNGLMVTGASEVLIVGGEVSASGADNVVVEGPDASVSLDTVGVTNAAGHGLLAGGGTISLTAAVLQGNGGAGIAQPGSGLTTKITVDDTEIANNVASGIELVRGRLSLTSSAVFGNGANTDHAGVKLTTSVTLDALKASKLYGNRGAQLYIRGVSGSEIHKLPHSCGADEIQVSCYPQGSVGIRATNLLSLDANGVRTRNSIPQAGTDYEGDVNPLSPWCGKAALTCP